MNDYEKKHKVKKWWSTNIYIANEIVECTDQLIKHQKGYPGEMDNGKKPGKYSISNEKKWKQIPPTLVSVRC